MSEYCNEYIPVWGTVCFTHITFFFSMAFFLPFLYLFLFVALFLHLLSLCILYLSFTVSFLSPVSLPLFPSPSSSLLLSYSEEISQIQVEVSHEEKRSSSGLCNHGSSVPSTSRSTNHTQLVLELSKQVSSLSEELKRARGEH